MSCWARRRGGVEALIRLVSAIPGELPAALFAVVHVARTRSVLLDVLSRVTDLSVAHAEDGEPIVPGQLRIAPPDRHLILEHGHVRLRLGPEENGARPAVDPLFRSAALAFGPRVIGVILTGSLDDGAAGLVAIKRAGELAVVQHPDDAAVAGMPLAALDAVIPDLVVPLRSIPAVLDQLVRGADTTPQGGRVEGDRFRTDQPQPAGASPDISVLSALTRPSCQGALWESTQNGVLQFRCRVGHTYSAQAMLDTQALALDRSLWAGLRSLEERAALNDRLAEAADAREHGRAAKQFRRLARQARLHAQSLRAVVTAPQDSTPDTESPAARPGYEGPEAEPSDVAS